jgi:hypothetical protein
MNVDQHVNDLERLRAEGYADASSGRPDRSGALHGPMERLEYYKGWEDWQVQNHPKLQTLDAQ